MLCDCPQLSISIDLHNITVGRDDAIRQDRSVFLHIIDGVSNEMITEERNEKRQEHYCIYRMSVQLLAVCSVVEAMVPAWLMLETQKM